MTERKMLVTVSFVVNGLPEDYLGEFVSSVEDGLRRGVAGALENAPEGMTREQALELASQAIEFYGATITLQRPLFTGQEA